MIRSVVSNWVTLQVFARLRETESSIWPPEPTSFVFVVRLQHLSHRLGCAEVKGKVSSRAQLLREPSRARSSTCCRSPGWLLAEWLLCCRINEEADQTPLWYSCCVMNNKCLKLSFFFLHSPLSYLTRLGPTVAPRVQRKKTQHANSTSNSVNVSMHALQTQCNRSDREA